MSSLFKEVVLSLYSSDKILKDSFGELSNHKTVNVRTLKPELGGLFDPKVFGPSIDYECFCGKYQGIKNKNQKCEQCNVLITSSKVRRWRMGHIRLNVPVTNPFFLRGFAFRLGKIVSITPKAIEDLIYYNCYIVINKGKSSILKNKQILDKQIDLSLIAQILQEMLISFDGDQKKKKEIEELLENLNTTDVSGKIGSLGHRIIFIEDYLEFLRKNWEVSIKTGSEALHEIIKNIDLQKELANLKTTKSFQLEKNTSNIEIINDRIRVIQSLIDNDLKLESMIMYNLPVIPAGIRPATKLSDDNSIATTQVNNLYRKVILINKRLFEYGELNKKMRIFFLEIIHNERRRLQKAVDQLLQGNLSNKTDLNVVKSLSQVLSGKEGIPRKHSLGKRVDYSARSVIVPNPSLELDQVGLPVEMALVLYKPFLIRELLEKKFAFTVKEAANMITEHSSVIFSLLNRISKNHPVILNRAPTLHRLGIQGFFPLLILGKSIQLHPLVTTAFNADFDGDQMAVHLPLTEETKQETKEKLIACKNIISPQNNNLIITPTQDVILGIYYLTCEIKKEKLSFYYDIDSLVRDYELQKIDIRQLVLVPASILGKNFSGTKNKLVFTTLGKIIFNKTLPFNFPYYISNLQYYNEKLIPSEEEVFEIGSTIETLEEKIEKIRSNDGWKKKQITIFLNNLLKTIEAQKIANFLDELKNLGFSFATKSGLSISLFDIPELENKKRFSSEAQQKIIDVEDYKNRGFYSSQEAYEKKIEIWTACKDNLENELITNLGNSKSSSFYSIWNSGARANSENLTQIFAMRGNMTNYKGEVIETPILSSLKEGLDPFEFFISVYGAIKGMIDIALKTAEAGYLSRRLVETVQNIVVSTEDCFSTDGTLIGPLQEYDVITNENITLIPLSKRVYGRYLAENVFANNQLIIEKGTLILAKELEIITKYEINVVKIRNSLECKLFPTVCQKCYGIDLSKQNTPVPLGTAVGIIAAQSLGEPGTQLTMRTFHSGGVTGQQEDIVQGLPKVKELLDNIIPPKEAQAILARITGRITDIKFNEATGETIITQVNEQTEEIYFVPHGKKVRVKKEQLIRAAENITTGKVDLNQYLEIVGKYDCQEYIKKEIWKVYYSQGIEINEKHIEMFTRQMLSNVQVTAESEKSKFLVGDITTNIKIQNENKRIANDNYLIKSKPILLGIKKVINYFPSFLSAISFQNTSKLLFDYALFQPKDSLEGVKENMIIGQLVPVGSGFVKRQEIENELKKKVEK